MKTKRVVSIILAALLIISVGITGFEANDEAMTAQIG